jgi:hypothetical protein
MNDWKNASLVILFFVLISGIWIAPGILHIGDFLFHPNAQFSDVLISHWTDAQFIREAYDTWKTFPLWNPLILSGAPLVGDPLFGIWYPPNWLSYLLPVGIAINLLFWFHLVWAGLGMVCWLRSEGLHWSGALVAGIAFSGMPKLIGHVGLGHLGLVSSVAWTPWLLLVTRRLILSLSSSKKESIKWFALGGLVAGILFIADPRWVLPAAILDIFYAIRTYHFERPGVRIFTLKGMISILSGGLIFAGMIAGLAIPMIEFTLRSTRLDLSLAEIADLSLRFTDLLGVLIPQYGAWPESITFAGLLILGLVCVALLGRARGWLFWLCMGIGSVILALGDQTPLYPFLLKFVPGFQLLRVPARFSFIGFFSLSTLAGLGLDLLIRKDIPAENKRRIRLGWVGLCSTIVLLSVGSILIFKDENGGQSISWVHMISAAILILILGFYSLKREVHQRALVMLWILAVILDLFLMDRSLLEVRSREELFETDDEVMVVLHSDSSLFRIFSPSYSIPQNIGAEERFQLADGVNPLQLKTYYQFMAQTVGFDPMGYSVTLPPFPDGNPDIPLYQEIDPVNLGLLNVEYVVSAYSLSINGLDELLESDGTYLYRNSEIRPRAWIQAGSKGVSDEWRKVEKLEWSPNRISMIANGEGLLVLSEIVYPGWEAFVDGSRVDISSYEGILRSIPLAQGEHIVEFYYRPLSVRIGAYVTLLTLLIFIFLWLRK